MLLQKPSHYLSLFVFGVESRFSKWNLLSVVSRKWFSVLRTEVWDRRTSTWGSAGERTGRDEVNYGKPSVSLLVFPLWTAVLVTRRVTLSSKWKCEWWGAMGCEERSLTRRLQSDLMDWMSDCSTNLSYSWFVEWQPGADLLAGGRTTERVHTGSGSSSGHMFGHTESLLEIVILPLRQPQSHRVFL